MICDTSFLIEHARGLPAATRFFTTHRAEMSIPFVAAAELLMGARRSDRPEVEIARVERLMSIFPIEWPDESTVTEFAEIMSALLTAGTPIGAHDVWIAALARQLGRPIVTSDKDFEKVAGISIVHW